MLTTTERRFIRYWQEQREGGKVSYMVLYSVVGTFIVTLIFSVFLVLFFQIVFGSFPFYLVVIAGFLVSIISAWMSWSRNEQKLQQIIRREVDADSDRSGQESVTPIPD